MRAIKLLAIALALYSGWSSRSSRWSDSRGWYRRAVANPEVEIVRGGEKTARRAVPVTGVEREQIARDYPLPFWIRLLAGFPPRSYLRLDPR